MCQNQTAVDMNVQPETTLCSIKENNVQPKRKHPAPPANPEMVAIAVAVALCSGGNHMDEMNGPEVKATGPASPIAMCAK